MLVLASLSGKSTHDPPHGVVGRPVILMFLSHGACLRHCYLFCRLSRHHRCGVTVLGSCRRVLVFIFFIAVYFVGGLNDLV